MAMGSELIEIVAIACKDIEDGHMNLIVVLLDIEARHSFEHASSWATNVTRGTYTVLHCHCGHEGAIEIGRPNGAHVAHWRGATHHQEILREIRTVLHCGGEGVEVGAIPPKDAEQGCLIMPSHGVVLLGADASAASHTFEHHEQVGHADYSAVADVTRRARGNLGWRRRGRNARENTQDDEPGEACVEDLEHAHIITAFACAHRAQ
jgi:hypothetical protein